MRLGQPSLPAALPALHLASARAPVEVDAKALAAQSSPEPVARALRVADVAITAAPARSPTQIALPSLATILFALWALGAAAVLARFGVGLLRAQEMANTAKLVEVQGSVEIRVSSAIETPAVLGLFSPVILLPRDMDAWSDERRRVVLLHELAHVARRDCLANAIAQVACALHWFNPLAWIALRRLRIEQELGSTAIWGGTLGRL